MSRDTTIDRRRADALIHLTTTPTGTTDGPGERRGPAVQVTVALSTLLGLDEQPGELTGYGPLPPHSPGPWPATPPAPGAS